VDGIAHRAAAAQVLVADLDRPVPDDAARHHLVRVLRLRPGEVVCATDGRGGWRLCSFTGGRDPDGLLEPITDPAVEAGPGRSVTVGFAPVKGDRPEWVVQKLTELGVDRIAVFTAERSVVRWDGDRGERHLERLGRVAREAAQQCRRLWLPVVESVTLADLRAEGAVLADPGGRRLGPADSAVVIGPEGGWADRERQGADLVDLGTHVLRAETAALAAAVLLDAARRSPGRAQLTDS
jgi:16S rRNA (uracil1498-N3)-methyltransferase